MYSEYPCLTNYVKKIVNHFEFLSQNGVISFKPMKLLWLIRKINYIELLW